MRISLSPLGPPFSPCLILRAALQAAPVAICGLSPASARVDFWVSHMVFRVTRRHGHPGGDLNSPILRTGMWHLGIGFLGRAMRLALVAKGLGFL